MGELYRTGSGGIRKEDTVTFQQVEQAAENDTLGRILLPIAHGLGHMERLYVDTAAKSGYFMGKNCQNPLTRRMPIRF